MMTFARHSSHARRLCAAAIAAVAVAVFAAPAPAFQISGRVVNGTTGEPVSPVTIRIVNPSGGMMVEHEAQTIDESGHFRAEGLKEGAPVYLLRVDYKGVNYTEMVEPHGEEATVEVKVYEPTISWDRVHVSLPHAIVARSGDTLHVEKFYQVMNHTDPPKTVAGPGAAFTFYLPEDLLRVASVQVRALGMPLPVTPRATDEPGFYTIDYPMRPGPTQVNVSMELPYAGGRYDYIEKFKYNVDEVMFVTDDPTLSATSEVVEIEPNDDFHGFTAFSVAGLGPDRPLQMTLQGGSTMPAAASRPQIFIIHGEGFAVSIVLMFLVVVVLVGFLLVAAQRTPPKEAEREVYERKRQELLDQLAKLDDLYRMEAVSETIYKLKRTELMNTLAQVYYRLRFDTPASPQASDAKEDTARV
jgi:hypothetical protein